MNNEDANREIEKYLSKKQDGADKLTLPKNNSWNDNLCSDIEIIDKLKERLDIIKERGKRTEYQLAFNRAKVEVLERRLENSVPANSAWVKIGLWLGLVKRNNGNLE